jgi:glyceraldehyde 3-phosphate dehydrogenase
MKTKVAINGFGRIGRNALKIAYERDDLEIVAINDIVNSKKLTHLLKYDSTYGIYNRDVAFDDAHIIIDGHKIKLFNIKNPSFLPWGDLGIDVVIESSGEFVNERKARGHINHAGAKKVVISAPSPSDGVSTIIYGVNDHQLPASLDVLSAGSCTTNCASVILDILDRNIGIEKAMMTTTHSYTNSQSLLDKPSKNLREARSAGVNIVPSSTGASIAVTRVLPNLIGNFEGYSVRVPTSIVSMCDFSIVIKRAITKKEVNEFFKKAAAEDYYQGILDINDDELVSTDYIGNSHSAIVDLDLTDVIGQSMIKVVAWYDNEWGYSNRLVELVADVGKQIKKHHSQDVEPQEAHL